MNEVPTEGVSRRITSSIYEENDRQCPGCTTDLNVAKSLR